MFIHNVCSIAYDSSMLVLSIHVCMDSTSIHTYIHNMCIQYVLMYVCMYTKDSTSIHTYIHNMCIRIMYNFIHTYYVHTYVLCICIHIM